MNDLIDIIFLGDIVGRPGRRAVSNYLAELTHRPDFIIANVENASHGFGLTERNYNELNALGINVLTSGNHIWDKKEIFEYIEGADKLLRPLNYPCGTQGVGSGIFKYDNITLRNNTPIGVINILGRIFMSPIDSPWSVLEDEIKKIQYETPVIIIDFHAEASAEKISMGYFADKLGVSAVIGTHTHIQTADEKILEGGAAYITDVGFCGACLSVIGMDISTSLKRLVTSLPQRFDVASMGKAEVNGVRILINPNTGCAEKIDRIKYFTEVD